MKSLFIEINKIYKISLKTINFIWNSSHLYFILTLIINIILGIAIPFQILINKYLLDSLSFSIYNGTVKTAVIWMLITCFFYVTIEILTKFNIYFKRMLADFVNLNISHAIFTEIEMRNLSDFDDAELYNQISKINNEALMRAISILDTMIMYIKSIINIFVIFNILMVFNKTSILIAIIILLPIFFSDVCISSKMHEIYKKRLEKLRLVDAIQNLVIQYQNIKEIKAYKLVDYLKKYVTKVYQEYISQDKRIRKKNIFIKITSELPEFLITIIIKIYILIIGVQKKQTIGTVVMQINAIDNLIETVKSIIQLSTSMYEDILYIESLFDFIKGDNELKEQSIEHFEKININSIEKIEFKNVCFRYPKSSEFVLSDISFCLVKNQSYLIVGLNGSGKTTLIKLLLNLYQPVKGEILVNGINLKEIEPESYRRMFSVTFQDFIKYPLSVKENILFGDIKNQNYNYMRQITHNFGIDKFVERLPNQYDTILKNEWCKGTELSEGQWQKLAIARAQYRASEISIFDESTASLDVFAEEELYKNIFSFSNIKTCVLISHRLNTAHMVDNIILLGEKTIKEFGNFDELMNKKGIFYSMYKKQSQNYTEGW